MRCETTEVLRDGKKVIINLSDFNSETMIKWGYGVISAPGSPPPLAPGSPPPPAPGSPPPPAVGSPPPPAVAVAKKLID